MKDSLFILLLEASFIKPRGVCRILCAYRLDLATSLMALGIAVILSVGFVFAMNNFEPIFLFDETKTYSPFKVFVLIFLTNLLMIFGILCCGLMLGGKGTFQEGVLFFAWLQFLQFLFQVGITVITFAVGPLLGGLFALMAMITLFAIFFTFINELHRFGSIWRSIVTFFLAVFIIFFIISVMLIVLGIQPPEMRL